MSILATRIKPVPQNTSTTRVCPRCGIDYTPRDRHTHCKDCRRYT